MEEIPGTISISFSTNKFIDSIIDLTLYVDNILIAGYDNVISKTIEKLKYKI